MKINLLTFKAIFPDYISFDSKIVLPILSVMGGPAVTDAPAYLDASKMVYDWKKLFFFLSNKYDEFYALNDEDRQIKLLQNALIDTLPALYMKTKTLTPEVLASVENSLDLLKNNVKYFNEDPDNNFSYSESVYSSTPADEMQAGDFNMANIKDKSMVFRKDKTMRIMETSNLISKITELSKIKTGGYIYEFINTIEISSLWESNYNIGQVVIKGMNGKDGKDGAAISAEYITLINQNKDDIVLIEEVNREQDDKIALKVDSEGYEPTQANFHLIINASGEVEAREYIPPSGGGGVIPTENAEMLLKNESGSVTTIAEIGTGFLGPQRYGDNARNITLGNHATDVDLGSNASVVWLGNSASNILIGNYSTNLNLGSNTTNLNIGNGVTNEFNLATTGTPHIRIGGAGGTGDFISIEPDKLGAISSGSGMTTFAQLVTHETRIKAIEDRLASSGVPNT